MGGANKNVLWCSRTFWRKMCSSGLVFFQLTQNKTHQKRGISLSSHTNESNRRPRNATQKKRVLIKTNSPVVGTVENEIDFFSVRPFRSTLCWLNAYQGERSSISSNVSNFFPSFICVDRAVEREKKSQKSRGRTHRQKGGESNFFLSSFSSFLFSLSLSRSNCRKLKRRTCKECPPVFQHDYTNIK